MSNADRDAHILRLYVEQRLSTAKIGARLGLSASYVARILRQQGAPMRPRGRVA